MLDMLVTSQEIRNCLTFYTNCCMLHISGYPMPFQTTSWTVSQLKLTAESVWLKWDNEISPDYSSRTRSKSSSSFSSAFSITMLNTFHWLCQDPKSDGHPRTHGLEGIVQQKTYNTMKGGTEIHCQAAGQEPNSQHADGVQLGCLHLSQNPNTSLGIPLLVLIQEVGQARP